ncbi:lipase family protein [Nocardioides sp.]|uniref:lipase family protein n=1 Tax=Nocardioides sp. TaxID=35761 RepID=UPI0035185F80
MNRRGTALALALASIAAVGLPAAAPAVARDGARPGAVLATGPAGVTSQVAGASRSIVITYETTTSAGEPVPATGLLLVPAGPAPADGWPLVVYGHMTTGAADRCAPTQGVPGHSELRRMQQGDDLARSLLAAGVAVARPDYEGLGTPGGHPYLQGGSLGRSMIDMVRATRDLIPLNGRWIASGHSEGGVAALNVADVRQASVPGMELRGVQSITPVTQMDVLIRLFRRLPVALPPVTGGLVALAALILKGQATEDPALETLALNGGLSPHARALWGDLETRCLNELSRTDSWGGLPPAAVLGPRGEEFLARALAKLDADDVRRLRLQPVPVRIDEGLLDAVAPFPLTEQLVRTYRRQGVAVTHARWLADHSTTNSAAFSVPPATRWILARLR